MNPDLPLCVSPLIKFGRWSMLGLGIFYGIFHQERLTIKEKKLKETESKMKAIRDAKLAEEKQRAAEAEMHAIDILSGKY